MHPSTTLPAILRNRKCHRLFSLFLLVFVLSFLGSLFLSGMRDPILEIITFNVSPEAKTLKTPTIVWPPLDLPVERTPDIPSHIKELFGVKELLLVALDPVLLNCIKTANCVELSAVASVHVGTWANNTADFGFFFALVFESSSWTFEALSATTARITRRYPIGYSKTVVVSVLQIDPRKDYVKIETFKQAEITQRAIKRFTTIVRFGVTIPDNIDQFVLAWERGRFMECRHDLKHRFNSSNAIIQPHHLVSFSKLTDLLLDNGQIAFLGAGTLLGWYRQCGVIPYTTDIDAYVKVAQLNDSFIDSLENSHEFKMIRRIGKKEYGYEFTVRFPGEQFMYADIFYLYPHNSTLEWTTITYGKDSNYMRYRCFVPTVTEVCTGDLMGNLFFVPTVTEVCTGDLMGNLFFVPCNTLEVLQATYGKSDWLKPQSNYTYVGHDRLILKDGHWNTSATDIMVFY